MTICTCGYHPRPWRTASVWEVPCLCGLVYESTTAESVCRGCGRQNVAEWPHRIAIAAELCHTGAIATGKAAARGDSSISNKNETLKLNS